MKNLILTPLKGELTPLISSLDVELIPVETERRRGWQSEALQSNFFFTGHGKVECAIWTSYILQCFPECENVILVGAGGGLQNDISVGTPIVGRETIEHDYHEKFDESPAPRFVAEENLLRSFSAHGKTGVILSGDEDIVDHERRQQLHRQFQADVVAWEGAGAARTARFFKKNFIEIRGVTDGADQEAVESFKTNLAPAMREIGKLLRLVL